MILHSVLNIACYNVNQEVRRPEFCYCTILINLKTLSLRLTQALMLIRTQGAFLSPCQDLRLRFCFFLYSCHLLFFLLSFLPSLSLCEFIFLVSHFAALQHKILHFKILIITIKSQMKEMKNKYKGFFKDIRNFKLFYLCFLSRTVKNHSQT